MQRTGPDSLEGWFVAVMVCLISTLMYGSAGLSSMLFVACIARYDTDRNEAAFPFVLGNVLQASTGPFAGYFAKRFGIRAVVLIGSCLGFVGIGTCFFAESITTVTVLWGIIFGTGFGFSTLLLPAIMNNYFLKHRSKALGMSYLGSPIGFLIFPFIFDALLDNYGLSGTFLFLSGINLHCVPLSLLLRDPSFKEDGENLPLNHGVEQVTYLSTDTRTIIQNGRPETEKSRLKNDEKIRKTNVGHRRFSLEFLWKKSTPGEPSNKNEQYVLTLSESETNGIHRKNKYLRSFEKTNRNYYEISNQPNVLEFSGKSDSVKSKTDNISSDTSRYLNRRGKEGAYINHGFENFEDFTSMESEQQREESLMEVKEINRDVKEMDKLKKAKSLKNISNYTEFSTIYFGANQNTCSFTGGNDGSEYKPNLNTANGKVNAYSCMRSLASPIDINHKPSKIATVSSNTLGGEKDISNSLKTSDEEKLTNKPRWLTYFQNKSLLNMYCSPVFIVMSIVNAIFNLQYSTLITVIIDFSRDHHVDPSCEKYIMMCISIMGVTGMMGFGWVTDGGYMSRNRFASLCLFVGSISTAVLPVTVGFKTLLGALAVWCVSQSCFVLLIPAIIADYFEEDIQAVAVSACNVLCAPLYLIIPPLIGYFRDGKGSYDYIFYLLSILSLLNSIAVFIVPYLARLKKEASHERSNTIKRSKS